MPNENKEMPLIEDLENMSAEELEKLAELDDGNAQMDHDDQNFTIEGINDLNNPTPIDDTGDEETPPKEDETTLADEATALNEELTPPKPVTPVIDTVSETPEPPAPEIDYQAKYIETMERLANQKLLDDTAPPTPVEPPAPVDTRTAYERALENTKLDDEQQARFDELSQFDEDAANDFMERAKEKQIVSAMLERQETEHAERAERAERAKKTEQQQYTDAINTSENLKNWQKEGDTWDDVQGMHARLLRGVKYAGASTAEQMTILEQRFSKFIGVESDTKPAEPVPPTSDDIVNKKIADVENNTPPPSSLSSIAGGNTDQKPGQVNLDDSSSGADIQRIMNDLAESDDPEAIDKYLASVNVVV